MINRDTLPKKQKKDLISRLLEEDSDVVEVEGAERRRKVSRDEFDKSLDVGGIASGDVPRVQEKFKNRWFLVGVVIIAIFAITGISSIARGSSSGEVETSYVGTLPPTEKSWGGDIHVKTPVDRCKPVPAYEIPAIDAEEYFTVFVESGQIGYEKNGRDKVAFASIVKLLSALVVVDTFNLDAEVGLLEGVNAEGNGIGIEVGDVASVRNLLGVALVGSKNDAMLALAQNYPGGVDAFVTEMQNKAEEIGMTGTSISNPVGYDAPNQYSTLDDIVLLITVAERDPVIAEILTRESWEFESGDGLQETVESTNELLGTVAGVVGGKTGYTAEAGWSLVEYVDGDQDFVTVVLGAGDRYEATSNLITAVREGYMCD